MTEEVAGALAATIRTMRHPQAPAHFVRGGDSVFHLLVRAEDDAREVGNSLGHPPLVPAGRPGSYVVTVTPGPTRRSQG
jgi:hypothetical protein